LDLRLDRRGFLTAGVAAALPLPVAADDRFLDQATLRILIPNSVGGGTDRLGRLYARHLERRLPSTRIAVETLTGGNGRLAALEAWQARPDGLTLILPSSSLIYVELLGQEALPFRLAGFSWIGSFAGEQRALLVSAAARERTLAALLRGERPWLLAADGATSSHYIDALLLNALTGSWIRPVTGYDGGARSLAVINGEVELLINSVESMLPLLEDGAGSLVLRMGRAPLAAPFEAVPWLGELPLAPGREALVDAVTLHSDCGRPLATTPNVPPERLAVLRSLFADISVDPDFIAEAVVERVSVQPVSGEQVTANFAALEQHHAAVRDLFRNAVACGQRRADQGETC